MPKKIIFSGNNTGEQNKEYKSEEMRENNVSIDNTKYSILGAYLNSTRKLTEIELNKNDVDDDEDGGLVIDQDNEDDQSSSEVMSGDKISERLRSQFLTSLTSHTSEYSWNNSSIRSEDTVKYSSGTDKHIVTTLKAIAFDSSHNVGSW